MDRTSNNLAMTALALLMVLGIWWWTLVVPLRILEHALTPPEELIEDATGRERPPLGRPRIDTALASPPTPATSAR